MGWEEEMMCCCSMSTFAFKLTLAATVQDRGGTSAGLEVGPPHRFNGAVTPFFSPSTIAEWQTFIRDLESVRTSTQTPQKPKDTGRACVAT